MSERPGRKPGPQETPIGGGNNQWKTGGSADMATLFTRDGKKAEPGTGGRNSTSSFNTRAERTKTPVTSTVSGAHAHHWRIEEPNGSASLGTCKGCGERKEFRNWITDLDFDKDY